MRTQPQTSINPNRTHPTTGKPGTDKPKTETKATAIAETAYHRLWNAYRKTEFIHTRQR